MHVRVRLFAMLRERAGVEEVELDLPEGALVQDALDRVAVLSQGVPVLMAVNRQYAEADAPLRAGDELALIPPVSGGSGSASPAEPAQASPAEPAQASRAEPAQAAAAVSAPSPSETTASAALGRARVSTDPLTLDPLIEYVRDPRAGAIVTFLGVTREVALLEYEAYAEMAERQISEIVAQAIDRHGLCSAAAEHRVGIVPLSEPSVAVAASAPHRDEAFAGAREIIDEIKAQAAIWKKEKGEWVRGVTPG